MFRTLNPGIGLFAVRLSLFLMMLMWALTKVVTPASYAGGDESPGILGSFYGVDLGGSLVLVIGVVQIAFLVAFVVGLFPLVTTGGVMLMNLVTLAVVVPKFAPAFAGGDGILFAASMPIFGASLALFLMRDQDTMLSLGAKRGLKGDGSGARA